MSKYRLTQRYPNFMTGFDVTVVDFNTIDELKQVNFVNRWMSKPEFVRLSISRNVLMAEQKDTYFGIAFIKNLEGNPKDLAGIDLPIWEIPRLNHL